MEKDFKDSKDKDIEELRLQRYSELAQRGKYKDDNYEKKLEEEMLDLKVKAAVILIIGAILIVALGLFLSRFTGSAG